jgi:hypothetical protein
VCRPLSAGDARLDWWAAIRAGEAERSPVRRFCEAVGPWSSARLQAAGRIGPAAGAAL